MIFIIISNYKAQNIVPFSNNNLNIMKDGNYIKDTQGYFEKFLGIWKYSSNSEELILKIVKGEKIEHNSYFIDELFGGFKYTSNNIVKVDNLNFQFTDYSNYQNFSNIQGNRFYNNYESVHLVGYEPVGQRRVYIDLEIIPNTDPVQMKWKMYNRENWVINGEGFKQGMGGVGIPKEMILIKQ